MYRRVFINVPFDGTYKPFFDATVFTVIACGCVPRCALASGNAEQTRFARIVELVKQCPMGIHDLSRSGPGRGKQLPRLNMPFELGLFLGASAFGGRSHQGKTCIVLDSHSYRYRRFISDFSGHEVVSHDNQISRLIHVLRAWLATTPGIAGTRVLPGGRQIYKLYVEFQRKLPAMCRHANIQRTELIWPDYMHFVREWLLDTGFTVGES
jgi:hypothetical protein